MRNIIYFHAIVAVFALNACGEETYSEPPACEGDDCVCADVDCAGTAGTCEGDTAVLGQPDGACNAETGLCEFINLAVASIDCAEEGLVCRDGQCVSATDDDCADISCEGTPGFCDGDVAVLGQPDGTCNPDTGMCEYLDISVPTQDCAEEGLTCVEGRCVEPDSDLCAEVECTNIPASCDGDVALSEGVFDCDPSSGECIPAPGLAPRDCAEEGLSCLDGACVTDRGVTSCEDIDLSNDGFTVDSAPTVEGQTLFMPVSYGGGCEEHVFSACFDAFQDGGENLRVAVNIGHNANNDTCEGVVSEVVSFDLTQLIDAWQAEPNPGESFDFTVTGFRGILSYP